MSELSISLAIVLVAMLMAYAAYKSGYHKAKAEMFGAMANAIREAQETFKDDNKPEANTNAWRVYSHREDKWENLAETKARG